ncbi:hypothetical protein [Pararhizobium sp. A13]|uniref:hypothetical protein n=1 Tax=Pararhizobium sp. A13 TaxID=3133975 RepID=UPI00324C9BBE
MPKAMPVPPLDETQQPTPGVPDRAQDKLATPPVIDKGDTDPNDPVLDPALLPIGDPAGMA